MNNINKNSYNKIFRRSFSWLVVLMIFFGNFSNTFANSVLLPGISDENNPETQEFPPEFSEEFPTPELESNTTNKDTLDIVETLIDKERLNFFFGNAAARRPRAQCNRLFTVRLSD